MNGLVGLNKILNSFHMFLYIIIVFLMKFDTQCNCAQLFLLYSGQNRKLLTEILVSCDKCTVTPIEIARLLKEMGQFCSAFKTESFHFAQCRTMYEHYGKIIRK